MWQKAYLWFHGSAFQRAESKDAFQVSYVAVQAVAGLYLAESLALFVRAGRDTEGGAGNFGGEDAVLLAFGYTRNNPCCRVA